MSSRWVGAMLAGVVAGLATVAAAGPAPTVVVYSGDEDLTRSAWMQQHGGADGVRFVPIDDVDQVYFEKAYYLGPEKGAARPYALLAEAMRQTRLCAVARFSYRGKDYLIMLRPVEEGIVLQQLRHAWEVRKFSDVPMQDADVRDSELDLAIKLIQQITHAQFKPDKYTDDVRERVLDLINRKVEGEEITATVPESPKAQVIDLMAALKASIGADSGESSAEDEDEPVEAKTTKKKASTRKGPKAAKKTTTKKKTAKKAEG